MLRPLTTPLLFLLLLPSPGQSNNATCPYDLPPSFRLIPTACYANATSPSATSCCWFVFAAYIYAAVRYSNLTGAVFLPPNSSSACSSSFTASLLHLGLVSPSLLPTSSCSLDGDGDSPSHFTADASLPCHFAAVSAVRSSADLSPAVRLCTSPADNLTLPSNCQPCQSAVINATFSLLNSTNSKDFITCGMAATIGIWSVVSPSASLFNSYVLCVLQALENIGDLTTTNLIPSPPPNSPTPVLKSTPKSRSVKIAASSAAAAVASVAAIIFLTLAMKKRRWRTKSITRDPPQVVIGSPLPTEGLYIFTKSELKQATNGYSDKLFLGEGGAGKVYLGKLPSGQHVAIKRFYKKLKLDEFYSEVEILAKLRHRNLATLVGYCVGSKEHVLVYEYMAGGNLSRALYHGELTWLRRLRIAVDVAEGLSYLHDFPDGPVVHRDVKPTNVLLTDGGVAKLSDFGVSRIVPSEGSHVSTVVRGTMGYVDPESFAMGHVSESADVYGFGVVMLELVTGMKAVVPTPSGGSESVVHVANGAMMAEGEDWVSIVDPRLGPEWDRGSAKAVFDLACRCVRPYKRERPRMTEVLFILKGVLLNLEMGMDPGGDVGSSGPYIDEVITDEALSTSTKDSTSLQSFSS